MSSRFQDQVPHHVDTNLLERCQEQLRDYDIMYKGWVEPRDHTISYLAAAYLELAKKYEELRKPVSAAFAEALIEVEDKIANEEFEQSVFAAQMETNNNEK